MTNPGEYRFRLMIPFLLLLSIAAASCSSKEIKTAESPKPEAVHAEPGLAEKDAKGQPQIGEADAGPERTTRERSVPGSRGTGTSTQLRSEIKSLESTPIYFEFDRADLRPDAQIVLRRLAEWLKNNTNYSVLIEGHCDDRGDSGYNVVLGQSRAAAAEKFLRLLGIEAERISTLSYGEERPAVAGKDEAAMRKNRRDEFRLKADR
jgi:peptidoglycan-associated lipoprotein